ncbi:MAG: hypothetical protein LBC92_01025 [Rickettsiales bacterium]|jgi:hypothetical protein|nr:hypothetical protein [Rickettsiales bacterium]
MDLVNAKWDEKEGYFISRNNIEEKFLYVGGSFSDEKLIRFNYAKNDDVNNKNMYFYSADNKYALEKASGNLFELDGDSYKQLGKEEYNRPEGLISQIDKEHIADAYYKIFNKNQWGGNYNAIRGYSGRFFDNDDGHYYHTPVGSMFNFHWGSLIAAVDEFYKKSKVEIESETDNGKIYREVKYDERSGGLYSVPFVFNYTNIKKEMDGNEPDRSDAIFILYFFELINEEVRKCHAKEMAEGGNPELFTAPMVNVFKTVMEKINTNFKNMLESAEKSIENNFNKETLEYNVDAILQAYRHVSEISEISGHPEYTTKNVASTYEKRNLAIGVLRGIGVEKDDIIKIFNGFNINDSALKSVFDKGNAGYGNVKTIDKLMEHGILSEASTAIYKHEALKAQNDIENEIRRLLNADIDGYSDKSMKILSTLFEEYKKMDGEILSEFENLIINKNEEYKKQINSLENDYSASCTGLWKGETNTGPWFIDIKKLENIIKIGNIFEKRFSDSANSCIEKHKNIKTGLSEDILRELEDGKKLYCDRSCLTVLENYREAYSRMFGVKKFNEKGGVAEKIKEIEEKHTAWNNMSLFLSSYDFIEMLWQSAEQQEQCKQNLEEHKQKYIKCFGSVVGFTDKIKLIEIGMGIGKILKEDSFDDGKASSVLKLCEECKNLTSVYDVDAKNFIAAFEKLFNITKMLNKCLENIKFDECKSHIEDLKKLNKEYGDLVRSMEHKNHWNEIKKIEEKFKIREKIEGILALGCSERVNVSCDRPEKICLADLEKLSDEYEKLFGDGFRNTELSKRIDDAFRIDRETYIELRRLASGHYLKEKKYGLLFGDNGGVTFCNETGAIIIDNKLHNNLGDGLILKCKTTPFGDDNFYKNEEALDFIRGMVEEEFNTRVNKMNGFLSKKKIVIDSGMKDETNKAQKNDTESFINKLKEQKLQRELEERNIEDINFEKHKSVLKCDETEEIKELEGSKENSFLCAKYLYDITISTEKRKALIEELLPIVEKLKSDLDNMPCSRFSSLMRRSGYELFMNNFEKLSEIIKEQKLQVRIAEKIIIPDLKDFVLDNNNNVLSTKFFDKVKDYCQSDIYENINKFYKEYENAKKSFIEKERIVGEKDLIDSSRRSFIKESMSKLAEKYKNEHIQVLHSMQRDQGGDYSEEFLKKMFDKKIRNLTSITYSDLSNFKTGEGEKKRKIINDLVVNNENLKEKRNISSELFKAEADYGKVLSNATILEREVEVLKKSQETLKDESLKLKGETDSLSERISDINKVINENKQFISNDFCAAVLGFRAEENMDCFFKRIEKYVKFDENRELSVVDNNVESNIKKLITGFDKDSIEEIVELSKHILKGNLFNCRGIIKEARDNGDERLNNLLKVLELESMMHACFYFNRNFSTGKKIKEKKEKEEKLKELDGQDSLLQKQIEEKESNLLNNKEIVKSKKEICDKLSNEFDAYKSIQDEKIDIIDGYLLSEFVEAFDIAEQSFKSIKEVNEDRILLRLDIKLEELGYTLKSQDVFLNEIDDKNKNAVSNIKDLDKIKKTLADTEGSYLFDINNNQKIVAENFNDMIKETLEKFKQPSFEESDIKRNMENQYKQFLSDSGIKVKILSQDDTIVAETKLNPNGRIPAIIEDYKKVITDNIMDSSRIMGAVRDKIKKIKEEVDNDEAKPDKKHAAKEMAIKELFNILAKELIENAKTVVKSTTEGEKDKVILNLQIIDKIIEHPYFVKFADGKTEYNKYGKLLCESLGLGNNGELDKLLGEAEIGKVSIKIFSDYYKLPRKEREKINGRRRYGYKILKKIQKLDITDLIESFEGIGSLERKLHMFNYNLRLFDKRIKIAKDKIAKIESGDMECSDKDLADIKKHLEEQTERRRKTAERIEKIKSEMLPEGIENRLMVMVARNPEVSNLLSFSDQNLSESQKITLNFLKKNITNLLFNNENIDIDGKRGVNLLRSIRLPGDKKTITDSNSKQCNDILRKSLVPLLNQQISLPNNATPDKIVELLPSESINNLGDIAFAKPNLIVSIAEELNKTKKLSVGSVLNLLEKIFSDNSLADKYNTSLIKYNDSKISKSKSNQYYANCISNLISLLAKGNVKITCNEDEKSRFQSFVNEHPEFCSNVKDVLINSGIAIGASVSPSQQRSSLPIEDKPRATNVIVARTVNPNSTAPTNIVVDPFVVDEEQNVNPSDFEDTSLPKFPMSSLESQQTSNKPRPRRLFKQQVKVAKYVPRVDGMGGGSRLALGYDEKNKKDNDCKRTARVMAEPE